MNSKENKALVIAAIAVIMLGQPALARGGGFGGGFGSGFGGSHGFGGMGVHGFNGGFSSSAHGDGRTDMGAEGDRFSEANRPLNSGMNHPSSADRTPNQPDHPNSPDNNGNHTNTGGNNDNNGNHSNNYNNDNNTNVTNNFNGNRGWAANHPYEAAGAAGYAWNHHYPYSGYGAYPYGGYYGSVGVFPDFPLIIDNTTTQQPASQNNQATPQPVIQNFMPNAQPAVPSYGGYGSFNGNSAAQQEMMHERARVFAQELVGALNQRANINAGVFSPQAVPGTYVGTNNQNAKHQPTVNQ